MPDDTHLQRHPGEYHIRRQSQTLILVPLLSVSATDEPPPPRRLELGRGDCQAADTGMGGVKIEPLTSEGQGSTRQETRDDSVPGVLFLTVSLDGTVKRREQPSPNTKVSSEDGRSSFNRG